MKPVILIFDIGKTNKKCFLFDEDYNIVHEESIQLTETMDEDDFPCEDLHALINWIKKTFERLLSDKQFSIKAINFSAYGASFVYLDNKAQPFLPLYNYLKPYPEKLLTEFYHKYGGEKFFAQQTASPVLGNLNSGMQLYRLKHERPEAFNKIQYALHLPQYLSYIFSGKPFTEITSIGCHTNLWNFEQHDYHEWTKQEDVYNKFAPIIPATSFAGYTKENISVGVGLHDSSAALVPYLQNVTEPFILLSTGTWCISLNPFNHTSLTHDELKQDCLCYLNYKGEPVKAARLFGGYEHEHQTKKIAAHFNVAENFFEAVTVNELLLDTTSNNRSAKAIQDCTSCEEAYFGLMQTIIQQQVKSIQLVQTNNIKKIYVDGGFSNNKVFMKLLAVALPQLKICKAAITQASALGAAMVINRSILK